LGPQDEKLEGQINFEMARSSAEMAAFHNNHEVLAERRMLRDRIVSRYLPFEDV